MRILDTVLKQASDEAGNACGIVWDWDEAPDDIKGWRRAFAEAVVRILNVVAKADVRERERNAWDLAVVHCEKGYAVWWQDGNRPAFVERVSFPNSEAIRDRTYPSLTPACSMLTCKSGRRYRIMRGQLEMHHQGISDSVGYMAVNFIPVDDVQEVAEFCRGAGK